MMRGSRFLWVAGCGLMVAACTPQASGDAEAAPSSTSTSTDEAQAHSEPSAAPAPPESAQAPTGARLTRLELHFSGPPVGPAYFRGYETTYSEAGLKRQVTGPGTHLRRDDAQALSAADVARLEQALVTRKIQAQPISDSTCTGGTSYTLILTYGDQPPTKLHAYDCGGQVTGTIAGDIKGFAADVNALFTTPMPW